MKERRRFSPEFKRRVVEEYLSGINTPAQIIRKHDISWGILSNWKKRYALGKLGNEPRYNLAYEERIKDLERMVGRLTMDNEFLKKSLSCTLEQTRKKESLLPDIFPDTKDASKGGAK
jgi:transposase